MARMPEFYFRVCTDNDFEWGPLNCGAQNELNLRIGGNQSSSVCTKRCIFLISLMHGLVVTVVEFHSEAIKIQSLFASQ